jgi:hypothetical protein
MIYFKTNIGFITFPSFLLINPFFTKSKKPLQGATPKLQSSHHSIMSCLHFLQRLIRKSNSDVKDNSAPPSYHECPLPAHLSSPSTSSIKASDTPQWRWTALQCKAWLFAVLTTYMNYDSAGAEAEVSKLGGYGPNIYFRTSEAWIELLGRENGSGLYLMLFQVRHRAVPKNIKISHPGSNRSRVSEN